VGLQGSVFSIAFKLPLLRIKLGVAILTLGMFFIK
jgi:hypothetical protein